MNISTSKRAFLSILFLARPVGFEPTTNRFEVCDSIQLSYGRSLNPTIKMGWVKGLEPSTSGATTRHSDQLSYTHHFNQFALSRLQAIGTSRLVRLEGFELSTHGLEVRCSIQLSYRRIFYLCLKRLGLISSLLCFVKTKCFHHGFIIFNPLFYFT